MRFDCPLDDVFLSRSHVQVLRALHRLPEGLPASGREIARRAGITHPTAIKALSSLVETGLVAADRSPSSDAYSMNPGHLFAGQITDLFQAEADNAQQLASFLREELLVLTDKVEWATLFGSSVWGVSTPSSDIDLALSCAAADVSEVEAALQDLSDATRRRFGNQINPLLSAHKRRPRTGIWKRLEEEGVPLIRTSKAVSP